MRVSTIKRVIIKRRFALLILLGLIIITTFIYICQVKSQTQTDAYFRTLTMLASSLNREQAIVLGLPASDADIQKTCFNYSNTGGGPAGGHSELWCRLSVVRSITVEPDATYITNLLKKLDRVANQQGMQTQIQPGTNVGYDAILYLATDGNPFPIGHEGCAVQVTYAPNGNTPGATADPTTLKYSLKCQAPASHVVPGFLFAKDEQ